MDIRVLGANQLNTLAAACRKAGEGLDKELVAGIERAVKPLHPAILRNIPPTMPKGYEVVLSASLRVRIARRASGVIVTVNAKGRKGMRELARTDKGMIRHPVYGYGRRRMWTKTKPRERIPGGQLIKNPWVGQAVKPGVVSEPFRRLEPQILDEIGKVVEDMAQRIAGA